MKFEVGNLYKIRDCYFHGDVNKEFGCYGLKNILNNKQVIYRWDFIEKNDVLLCVDNIKKKHCYKKEYWEESYPLLSTEMFIGYSFLCFSKRKFRDCRLVLIDKEDINFLEDLLPIHPG